MSDAPARCAVHPARPADDECPVCGRPRCGADAAAAPGGGCLACRGSTAVVTRPPVDLRAVVGAAAVCGLVVVPGAGVASEYVDAGVMGYVVPVVFGIVLGIAAEWGAGRARGVPIRVVAVAFALLGAGYSFRFVPGGVSPFSPFGDVVWTYLGAATGAWLWTVPPKRRPVPEGAE